ncbi:MAG: patatin-like phospholipase family protein [Methylobacteriaceae bacterium]|nr:patatin-like phospholipase family protein [Methylobacteriaceae bacterium]MBV9246120.1 patatin-like phospholipase family protein [Methylobacteriaceae bacterium]MBV9637878.1 patatin-like phospholipase family protein [Methylobacteriaceae bacterium]MBV9705005.1 patatin-like phospholipase family protein [Methylobacteriaceae bacterium]
MLSFTRKRQDEIEGRSPREPGFARGRRPRIGLALGAGAARGWAHIGVLKELVDQNLVPDIVVGTSIGAVVGGCFAGGKFAQIESFALSLTRRSMLSWMDVSFNGGGLLGGNRLKRRLDQELSDLIIESLPVRFAAVATEIGTGHEIWLTRGRLADSLRASYALPGVFEPVQLGGRWLFDGALVNPVPVTVCRAFGADLVIAINLSEPLGGRGTVIQDAGLGALDLIEAAATTDVVEAQANPRPAKPVGTLSGMLSGLGGYAGLIRRQFSRPANGSPGVASVMVDAFYIVQDRIARSRLAGDPPDVMITPRMGKIGLFDFHRADEMIAIGRDATRKAMDEVLQLIAVRHRTA